MSHPNGVRPDRGRGASRANHRGAQSSSRGRGCGSAGPSRNFTKPTSSNGRLNNGHGHESRAFGIKKLSDFLGKSNDAVIAAVNGSIQSYKESLQQADFSTNQDMMNVLVQVIGEKLCGDTVLVEFQNGLLAITCDDAFLAKLQPFMFSFTYDCSSGQKSNGSLVDRSPVRNLQAICNLCAFVFCRMQTLASEKLLPVVEAACSVIELLRGRNKVQAMESAELERRLQKLKGDIADLKKVREKNTEEEKFRKRQFQHQLTEGDRERLYHLQPPEKFTDISIVPSAEEVRAEEEPFLRPNLVVGKYPTAETYLDVQFRLLREDFLAPLRQAVKEYLSHEELYSSRKKKLPPGTIRFYYDAVLKDVNCLLQMSIFLMQFSTANVKKIRWDKSKRLLNGTLVLLTSDNFKTIYFATVAQRDERLLQKGIVGITWEGKRPPSYVGVKFLIVECEVYFESYRHSLRALQIMAQPAPPKYEVSLLQTMRMAKYIVDASTEEIPPPRYITSIDAPMDFSWLLKANEEEIKHQKLLQTEEIDLPDDDVCDKRGLSETKIFSIDPSTLVSHKTNPLNAMEWPSASDLGMDNPQHEAFKSAIMQELSIIQGPPGTGKTYIGLQIMKFLLSNRHVLWKSPPQPRLAICFSQENAENVERDFEDELQWLSELEYSLRSEAFSRNPEVDTIRARRELNKIRMLKSNAASAHMRDPILIVCYTNHALDQFLEGILTIMRTMGINPNRNLVRVGGRSKVEDVAQYGINFVRQYYTKNHLFDQDYATSKNKTRIALQDLQNCRADLKSLYKDLCCMKGVVNFQDLFCVLHEMQFMLNDDDMLHVPCVSESALINEIWATVPEDLWRIYCSSKRKLLEWLGITYSFFKDEGFDPVNHFKKSFRVHRERTIPMNCIQDEEEGAEDEEGEEYDGEELRTLLLAHRLEEEIQAEDMSKKRKAARIRYYSLNEGFDFNAEYEKLNREYEAAEKHNDMRRVQEINLQLWAVSLEEKGHSNRMIFLQELLSARNEGRIDFPEVTQDLLARGHEREMPLRPHINEKWAIYFYVVDLVKKYLMKNIISIEDEIITAQEKFAEISNQGDGIILQQAMVVGLTTTGAAKYNQLLRMMKSRIVIVEEAAEVLESHIVTSLTEHCEQLILIGDHKQLRPPTTVYKLAKEYSLDVSLFERLIKNKISWHHLRAQHRMRPEICRLLVPTIYSDLLDHHSVINYPDVKGMAKNLFFITHSEWEKSDTDSMTKSNEYEAAYAVQLCRHLLLQGYKSDEVTILTTYIGQMFLIQKMMKAEGVCQGVRVTVVDNFQGEENEIIILSLVRSNDENRVGFLKTDNRICVALSRAKQGMYVICNMDCLLASKSKTWKSISDELHRQNSIGNHLYLRCEIHHDLIPIESSEDFRKKSPEGGCLKSCPGILPNCTHKCQKICHIIDRDHQQYKCMLDCQRKCPDPERHPCPSRCWQSPCPPCEIVMERELPCEHTALLECHVDYNIYRCPKVVERKLSCRHLARMFCHKNVDDYICEEFIEKTLDCGHAVMLPCFQPTSEFVCTEFVEKELPCGHMKTLQCSEDPAKVICQAPCTKELPCGHSQTTSCNVDPIDVKCITPLHKTKKDCGHGVDVMCWQSDQYETWKCVAMCDIRLDCGHACTLSCHLGNDPEHKTYRCRKPCARACPDGHPCKKTHPCFQDCDACPQRIDRALPCGHTMKQPCHVDPSTVKCQQPCQRTVDCPEEHLCVKKCYQSCCPCVVLMEKKSIDCEHTFKVQCHEVARKELCNVSVRAKEKSPCGHWVEVPCRLQDTCTGSELLQYCHQPCGHIVTTDEGGCGHPCQGDCSSCLQGRIHVKCKEKCGRVLACGHICKYPCSVLCPPCEEKCILRCKHSSCRQKCGVPCYDCKEKCKWRCEHQQCNKMCSELCNRDACNEPCRKRLKCDHECIGSCGEPCPPLCKICDKEEVEAILFGPEDEDDARFVFLEDCGHVIHRESMDQWMQEEGVTAKVAVKRCPRCQEMITQSVRYGNAIKDRLKGVLKVRSKIFGNDKIQQSAQMDVLNQLVARSFRGGTLVEFGDWLMNLLCDFKRNVTKGGPRIERHLKKVDQYTFESINHMYNWWEEAEKNLELQPVPLAVPPQVQTRYVRNEYNQEVLIRNSRQPGRQDMATKYRNKLLTLYGNVFEALTERAKKLPLSQQEIYDIDREFERCYDWHRLYRRRSVDNFMTVNGAQFMYNQLKQLLQKPIAYDEDLQSDVESKLKTLDDMLKTAAMDTSRQASSTFQAMGFSSQHWYTCERGHPYIVADCSNFNGAGRCPDCNAPVGSGSRNTRLGPTETAVLDFLGSRMHVQPPPSFGNEGRNRGMGKRRGRGRGRGRR